MIRPKSCRVVRSRAADSPGGGLGSQRLPRSCSFGGHAGEAYGLISDLYVDPSTGFGLVFIANGYTPGNAYQFGATSAFYTAEEDVYAALLQLAVPACTSASVQGDRNGEQLLLLGDRITWSGIETVMISIHDATGRMIQQRMLGSGDSASVPPGVYVVRCSVQGRHIVRTWCAL